MGASFLAIFAIPMCGHSKLVIVDNFYVFRSFLGQDEAHPELIVNRISGAASCGWQYCQLIVPMPVTSFGSIFWKMSLMSKSAGGQRWSYLRGSLMN
jgi:hypothetical protein